MLKILLSAMRLHHWIKNLFVFAALIFARQMFVIDKTVAVAMGFLSFCLISSSIYIINDIMDLEEDRKHPVKMKRPIASGKLGRAAAAYTALILGIVSLILAFYLNSGFGMIIVLYFVLNLAYSMFLKHKVVIDVIIIALGFVLRVLGGAAIISVSTSSWLILCTLFVSLFLGFCKRRNELVILDDSADEHRSVLGEYSPVFLDQMISVASALTIMSYALYTVSDETIRKFETRNLMYTIPFVIYFIFRYFYLVYKKEQGGSPTMIMLTDKPIVIDILMWIVSCSLILYL